MTPVNKLSMHFFLTTAFLIASSVSPAQPTGSLDAVRNLTLTPEQENLLKLVQKDVISDLQAYKACGPVWAANFDAALLADSQTPTFTVTYKDATGDMKTRSYQANINLIGLNAQIALRLNMIFFVDTDFNFYDSNQVIQLGTGVQVGGAMHSWILGLLPVAGMDLTYVPFTNIPGGLFIVSLNLGLGHDVISMVTGGTLTPIVDTNDSIAGPSISTTNSNALLADVTAVAGSSISVTEIEALVADVTASVDQAK